MWASDASDTLNARFLQLMTDWPVAAEAAIETHCIPHGAFKLRTQQSRAIVRTGEMTPYANIILIAGVAF